MSYTNAINSIFSLFLTAWSAGTPAITTTAPKVYWPGVQEPASIDGSKFWARVSQQTVIESQTALAGGDTGKKRYTAQGLIFVQIFCPKSDSANFQKGRLLAVVARDSFRGKTTTENVWIRNARINELSSEESFHRFNVVVEYEYDEIA